MRAAQTRLQKLRLFASAASHLGLGWALYRAFHAMETRSGFLKRKCPRRRWEDVEAPELRLPLLQNRKDIVPEAARGDCLRDAELIERGSFPFFSCRWVELGRSPDWHRNADTGQKSPRDCHWSAITDFDFGDIKVIWEPSRFGWAYTLARAAACSRSDAPAATFWRLLESWMDANPPNTGANWKCGQEASFRLFAVVFTASVIAQRTPLTETQKRMVSRLAVATGGRVYCHIDYALSQRNNHGISECAGLITAAAVVPDHTASDRWRARGLDGLRRQVADLVYADGSFAQHSTIYHRVLMDDLLWCSALLRAHRQSVPDWLTQAGDRALEFLTVITDPATGIAPVYGANDGSNILPLAGGDYLDFRPVVQAGHMLFRGAKFLPDGPWDELGAWLSAFDAAPRSFPSAPTKHPVSTAPNDPLPDPVHFRDGGIALWQHRHSRLFLRCPCQFRHRPSHADMLHADIEWRGQRITCDPGSYSYNAAGVFSGAMADACLHSSVTIDGQEPMARLGRFLLLPWPAGKAEYEPRERAFLAEHDAWRHLGVTHRRIVTCSEPDGFVITDELTASTRQLARLHWLLADLPFTLDLPRCRLTLAAAHGDYVVSWLVPNPDVTVVRASPDSARGWQAPNYTVLQPAISLAIEFPLVGSLHVVTRFAPA